MRRHRHPQEWSSAPQVPNRDTLAGLAHLSRHLDPVALQAQLRQGGLSDEQVIEALVALAWLRQLAVVNAGRKEGRP